jgi:3-oxoacyl-[acyl-carrier-protein] synthase-1
MSEYLNSLGLVCALGLGRQTVAANLFGKDLTGINTIENAVVGGDSLPFASVTATLPTIPDHLMPYSSRNFALALLALEEIDPDVRQAIDRFGANRIAVVMGTSTSGISEGESILSDPSGVTSSTSSFDFLQQEIGSVAESIAAYYQLNAPAITVSTACSSSAKALAVARRLLRQNLADVVIVGGCDSRCGLTLNGFHSLSALSSSGCNPFSINRDGTMIGEGAAIFLMSREEAGPELCGVGESSDAHNMTAPIPDGRGASTAMTAALADASITADQLSYINLHGTGTRLNDAMESRAVKSICPADIPCSSSKGQIGHTLGAAGAIEAALCWLTLESNPEQRLPPHCWDGQSDQDALLTGLVTDEDRLADASRHYLMSNSYAFGGSNIAIVLGS